MGVLVIDIGTSSIRAALVRPDGGSPQGGLSFEHRTPLPPASPAPGLAEFDPIAMFDAVLKLATAAADDAVEAGQQIDGVGIATQRSSAVVWDSATGEPLGPGLGWQDLRTLGACIDHQRNGIALAPNQAASKFEYLLDTYDPDRSRSVCLGTVDSWIVWNLTRGAVHVTEPSNACVTGLWSPTTETWSPAVADALRLPVDALPTIVDSIGVLGEASALPGSPPIAALLGDQQASLLGQGCTAPGATKATFGTGAMLDVCGSTTPPENLERSNNGTFPIVAWSQAGRLTWATEAIMLAAGAAVEWLRDSLGIVETLDEVDGLAGLCTDAGGVVFVPDLAGAGTPEWDFTAAGALFGLTRGTTRSHLARAVLEGVAQRGADLLEATDLDTGRRAPLLRIDGGMTKSSVFVNALANATERPVAVSDQLEATALGAAVGACLGLDFETVPATEPQSVVEPTGPVPNRDRWREAVARSGDWHR